MGATVPDGPMAMEQLLLIRMMNQHRMLAMDSAAKAVLTPSQLTLIAKANEEAESWANCPDPQVPQRIMQAAQTQVEAELTEEQKSRIQLRVGEDMQRVTDMLVIPQEEVWRQMLDEEQEKVWTAIDEEAEQAEPAKQRALFRQGKLAVGAMLSHEQQDEIGSKMKEIRTAFMNEWIKFDKERDAAAAVERDATAAVERDAAAAASQSE